MSQKFKTFCCRFNCREIQQTSTRRRRREPVTFIFYL